MIQTMQLQPMYKRLRAKKTIIDSFTTLKHFFSSTDSRLHHCKPLQLATFWNALFQMISIVHLQKYLYFDAVSITTYFYGIQIFWWYNRIGQPSMEGFGKFPVAIAIAQQIQTHKYKVHIYRLYYTVFSNIHSIKKYTGALQNHRPKCWIHFLEADASWRVEQLRYNHD